MHQLLHFFLGGCPDLIYEFLWMLFVKFPMFIPAMANKQLNTGWLNKNTMLHVWFMVHSCMLVSKRVLDPTPCLPSTNYLYSCCPFILPKHWFTVDLACLGVPFIKKWIMNRFLCTPLKKITAGFHVLMELWLRSFSFQKWVICRFQHVPAVNLPGFPWFWQVLPRLSPLFRLVAIRITRNSVAITRNSLSRVQVKWTKRERMCFWLRGFLLPS